DAWRPPKLAAPNCAWIADWSNTGQVIGLTAVRFVFNKLVKYGYALANLLGPRRPHASRHPGAARERRCDRGGNRRAVRYVAARRVAASEGADRCRPDRAPGRRPVAALRAARRGLSRRRRLDRDLPSLLGGAARPARCLPEGHRSQAGQQATEEGTPWTPW